MGFPWIAVALGASTLLDAMLSNKKYPPELEAVLRSLSVQAGDILNDPGLSEEEVAALFGKDFENVRLQGKNVREQTRSTLSNLGMSKTGTAAKAAQQDAWQNENLVTNAIRDMVIAKKAAKQQDLALATQMAQVGVGADVNRVEKGPQFTDLVGLLAMMGVGTGAESGLGEKETTEELTQYGIDLGKAATGIGGILPGIPKIKPLYSSNLSSLFSNDDPIRAISSLFSGLPW